PDTLLLRQNKRSTVIDFISDYPIFGLWIVLSIAQIMMWFILCPLLAGNLLNLRDKLGTLYKIKGPERTLNFLLSFGFVLVFCLCFYLLLVDKYIITDHYFLNGFNKTMFW